MENLYAGQKDLLGNTVYFILGVRWENSFRDGLVIWYINSSMTMNCLSISHELTYPADAKPTEEVFKFEHDSPKMGDSLSPLGSIYLPKQGISSLYYPHIY